MKKGAALAAKSIAKKGLMGAAKAGSKAFGAGLKKGVMTAGKTAGKSITTSGGKVVGGAGKVKQATGPSSFYKKGEEEKKKGNINLAKKFLKQACDLDHGEGCFSLGLIENDLGNGKIALYILTHA